MTNRLQIRFLQKPQLAGHGNPTYSTLNEATIILPVMSTLSFNCFVLGSDSSEVFTVKISKTENVSILKDLIKEKQSRRLNHVDASELILSEASLPVDADLEESLKNVDLTPLKPLLPLSQLFPHVKENCLHIVVQAPANGEPIWSFFTSQTTSSISFRGPGYQRRRRREIRSLLCIRVRVFFLLLPSFITNI